MELLSNPKTEYLLDASLEALHAESREWLNKLDFWNEEIPFLYKLLHKRTDGGIPSKNLATLDKEMIRITSESIGVVKSKLQDHERSLAALIRESRLNDEANYRGRHRSLLHDMLSLQVSISEFKKNVSEFSGSLNKSELNPEIGVE